MKKRKKITIISIHTKTVRTINKATQRIKDYPRKFLKKRFENGLIEIQNPELLYRRPFSII